MEIVLTWQSVVGAAAIIGAFIALVTYLKKLFGWFDQQAKQDNEIKDIKAEQEILVKGMLACLKGLNKLGCDGEVTGQITAIEDHLNKQAHSHA